MKQRILFVDDEPKLLEGLGRMLRGQRQEWAMDFASGGPAALEKLAAAPFDVVVSDMRMPEMDGAQFLSAVREHYPHIVRIVLSGQYDKEAFLRLASVAHRHLAKPCDPIALKETVSRACRFRGLLANDKLRALVSRLESVPSRPSIYLAAVRELETAKPSAAKVSAIMTQDVGMTAKILQLANSVLPVGSSPVAKPEQAVHLLGCDVLKALARALHTFSELEPANINPLSLDNVWEHSLAVSALARGIAAMECRDSGFIDSACVAGMLHDIGILILAKHLPDSFREVRDLTCGNLLPLIDAEGEVLGTTHAEIGAYLLGLWGLDPAIVEAVAWHHRPGECPTSGFSPLTAVHVADVLAFQPAAFPYGGPGVKIDEPYLARIGMTDCLSNWRKLRQRMGPEGVHS